MIFDKKLQTFEKTEDILELIVKRKSLELERIK